MELAEVCGSARDALPGKGPRMYRVQQHKLTAVSRQIERIAA